MYIPASVFHGLYDNFAGNAYKTVDEPEEKAIARLGITYGILRRLGFSEARVEECLRAIRGIELEEAYDWVSAQFQFSMIRLTRT